MRAAIAVVLSSGTLAACLIGFPTDPPGASAADGGLSDASAPIPSEASPAATGYEAEVRADHPVLYLRLGEKSGRAAKNEISSGDYNYAAQGVTYGAPGALRSDPDTAIAFDGGAGVLVMEPGVEFLGTSPFSVEVWFNAAAANRAPYAFIVDHEDYATVRHGWALSANNTEIRFDRWNNGKGSGVTAASPGADGAWHHLVATFSGAGLQIILDGVMLAPSPTTLPLDTAIASAYSVGNQNCSHCEANAYVGELDELAMYDKVLPIDRIKAHHDAAK